MCGRYVATTPTSVLAAEFEVEDVVTDTPPASYNVAPTDPVPAIAQNRAGQRVLGRFQWGLIPNWATDAKDAARRINARSETVLSKPTFRTAFQRRRCLIPADGFYEWERFPDGTRQAWYIHRVDGRPMAMAGVWDVWRDPATDGELIRTCAVITTAANDLIRPVHDRMPVILEPATWTGWLDRDASDPEGLVELLQPAAVDVVTRHRVSSEVNSVRHNGPQLIEVVAERPPAPIPLKLL